MNHCSSFCLVDPRSPSGSTGSRHPAPRSIQSVYPPRARFGTTVYRPWRTGSPGSRPFRWRQASPETPPAPRSHRRYLGQHRCDWDQWSPPHDVPSRGTWRPAPLSSRFGLGPALGYSVHRCLPCFSMGDLPSRKWLVMNLVMINPRDSPPTVWSISSSPNALCFIRKSPVPMLVRP